jgi:DegV family protein with EDD domain
MSKIAILTDSTANLPKAFVDQHNIRVIPLKIHWDGVNFEDGIDITPAEFYKRLENSATIPTTSQPPVDEFLKIYEELSADHKGIIVSLISSGLSGTVSSAKTAASMFSKIPVEVIDTRSTISGLSLINVAIAQFVEEDKELVEIKNFAEIITQRLNFFFVVDNLKYLQKGGRIGGASRYFGTALSIKPILYLDDQGKIDALDRVRTKRKAIEKLLELAVEKAAGKPAYISISHALALEEAMQLQSLLLDQIECKYMEVTEISPVIGTHLGSGALALGIYTLE